MCTKIASMFLLFCLSGYTAISNATTYNVTFRAEAVTAVGSVSDSDPDVFGENLPELYFYMGLFDDDSSAFTLQGFREDSPFSGDPDWNFTNTEISLVIDEVDATPDVYVYFALLDQDVDQDDYLGDYWNLETETVSHSGISAGLPNNNLAPLSVRTLFTSNDGQPYDGAGWADNFNLEYDVIFREISSVPQVPLPAAIWLFASALLGFVGISQRRESRRW